MEEFRLTVTGSTSEIAALEEFCREYGVVTERGLVSAYEGIAVTVLALHIIGRFEVVAQCLAAYGTRQEPRLNASYAMPQKGQRTIEDYSFEGVARALRQTAELHLDRAYKGPDSGLRT